MFRFDFPDRLIDTFEHGSFPKVKRISHSFNNPDWHYALHVHVDLIELIYVAGGAATIVVDQQVFKVQKGDILLVDKGVPHAITSNPENPSDIWTLAAANVVFCEQPQGRLISACTKADENAEFIERMMLQIQEFTHRVDIPVQAACNHLCAALIVLFRQMLLQSSATYEVKEQSLASRVLTYIDQNYEQRIDLEHLAAVFFVSASHISREFRNEFRISPINYLIDKRLSEARWLLINTRDSVQEIALKIGYENVYYFIKLFSGKISLTPLEYRDKFNEARPKGDAGASMAGDKK